MLHRLWLFLRLLSRPALIVDSGDLTLDSLARSDREEGKPKAVHHSASLSTIVVTFFPPPVCLGQNIKSFLVTTGSGLNHILPHINDFIL